jgi:hypothetical protein
VLYDRLVPKQVLMSSGSDRATLAFCTSRASTNSFLNSVQPKRPFSVQINFDLVSASSCGAYGRADGEQARAVVRV